MSIFTSFTAPLAAPTAFSSAGPSWRQGPHQVAQKSTITGVVRLASITSATKLASVPSLMMSPAGLPAVSPIKLIASPSKFALDNVSRPTWSQRGLCSTRLLAFDHAEGGEIDHQRLHAER